MTERTRPRSPHVQIYRPQLTSVLSFTHRLSGIALSVGGVILVVWLLLAAAGGSAFGGLNAALGSWFGRLLLFLWTFALFFHLCNGIRHLFWDAVLGFELANIYRSGWLVVVASTVLTVLTWVIAMSMPGVA
ncbi:succinate dehydrogenase, cytochrome b556 subunit [Ectothiorhodospiraceae bacterium WFHF3C12]|nr:succinate dehydrogenase, cytochrome b556 subunit [Ectothiorhodospiraceae bacterium WFHF3C12]